MRPHFTECKEIFEANDTLRQLYEWDKPVSGAYRFLNSSQLPMLITNKGCRAVCGTGADYYPWEDASATISTWILPVIGLMLQVPYESNEFISTLFFMARVVGSPISTMAYILWNIKTSGKCALSVDMATAYGEYPGLNSDYEQMRDSFYLLGVMNQYSIKHRMPRVEAEKLLRIALWSDSLQLEIVEDESRSLVKRRRKLARTIRESRKRGVVPVFITLMWFLFSLIVSIQAAFGHLGANATAHNMALGWLLAWLPSLILFSVVDRNPIAADTIRIKLNKLLDATRRALLNPNLRDTYIREIGSLERDFRWTGKLGDEDYFREDFFTRFAGQGRVRWHSGVAPPILAGNEKTQITRWGRGWLADGEKARRILVKGPENLLGLHWFDRRSLWQVLVSFLIFSSSIFGAFIISYFTPTVGLGCRSGGYLVYFILATVNALSEACVWMFVQEGSIADKDPLTVIVTNIHRRLSHASRGSWKDVVSNKISDKMNEWQNFGARDKWERLLLRPLDVFSSLWLAYIVFSQVFGLYRTCDCMSSIWASTTGGYVDFESFQFYRGVGVSNYWGASTALSSFTIATAFLHAIVEWCQQSHVATDDFAKAQGGLKWTRWFRKQAEPLSIHLRRLSLTFSRSLLHTPESSSETREPLIWTSKFGRVTTPNSTLRRPNIELEDGIGVSMSRKPSHGSTAHSPPPHILASDGSTPGLGISYNRTSATHRTAHPYAHSPSPSTNGIHMSRDTSKSSQGIDRKPLLSSPEPSHRRTHSSGTDPETGGDRGTDLYRSMSNISQETAVFDWDGATHQHLNRTAKQAHTRPPRSSYGERDLLPDTGVFRMSPEIPRSSPRVEQTPEDLDLPGEIPRARAY